MIESLSLKLVASYDSKGIQINDLKKINFIYGANGCGKTTISNLLHDSNKSIFSSCLIKWKNGLPVTTLVYNKEFRERNFGNGKINGIFTIGEATKTEIETIESKTNERKKISEEGQKKRETLNTQIQKKDTLVETFTKFCWAFIYKKYENNFKESFVGSMRSAELFKNKLLLEFRSNTSKLSSFDELIESAKTIFG